MNNSKAENFYLKWLGRRVDVYSDAIIPGLNLWPKYSQVATKNFWSDWRRTSPVSTVIGFYFCVLIVHLYCSFSRLIRKNSIDRSLEILEASPSYLLRQSFVMVKTLACLAYFSDPFVFSLCFEDSSQENKNDSV